FQTLVYLGLKTTTAINAVLLNSSAPLFMLLCSWMLERETATRRQLAGMLVSLLGILLIVSHGAPGRLLQLEFHAGDAWIVLAMLALGEAFHAYHAAGFATILAGVVLATRRAAPAQGLR